MKKYLAIVLLLAVCTLMACNRQVDADIYTTVYPVEFITQEIVKDKLTVASIYPRGKDVHDYEPQPKKIISITNADILFYIGLNLEPFIENGLSSTFKDVNTVRLSDAPDLKLIDYGERITETEHNHGTKDPHLWLYPLSLVPITKYILSELIKVYPEHTEFFTENANAVIEELEKIDQEYVDFLNSEEIANKTIVCAHDAYGYWGYFYNIDRLKINQGTNSTEAGGSALQENIELAKSLGIKHVSATKNVVPSDTVNTFLKAIDGTLVYLHPLETITNEEYNTGENYYTIMRSNLEVLKTVLPKK